MRAEKVELDDIRHPLLELGDIVAAGRAGVGQPPRGLGYVLIVGVACGIEHRADIAVALASQHPCFDESRFAAAIDDLGHQTAKRSFMLVPERQDMHRIFERHRTDRLQATPDFHAQIGRLDGKLVQQGQPDGGFACRHDRTYISSDSD